VPASPIGGFVRTTPVAALATFGNPGTGFRGVRPMDSLGSAIASLPAAGSPDVTASSFGFSQVSAAAYNSMSSMNHMRFECGIDLKGVLKTGRKRLIRGLWASPDSPEALYLGYMNYTASH